MTDMPQYKMKIAVFPTGLLFNYVEWFELPVPPVLRSKDSSKFTDVVPFVFTRRAGETDAAWAARLQAETDAEVEGKKGYPNFSCEGAARYDAADYIEGKDWFEGADYRLLMLQVFKEALDAGEVDHGYSWTIE